MTIERLQQKIQVRARRKFKGRQPKVWSIMQQENMWVSFIISGDTKDILRLGMPAPSITEALESLLELFDPPIHKTNV